MEIATATAASEVCHPKGRSVEIDRCPEVLCVKSSSALQLVTDLPSQPNGEVERFVVKHRERRC
jgi:hypothetical protein